MDTAKSGRASRTKVKVNDRVSVPNNYFGNEYLKALQATGVLDNRIYGRVTFVVFNSPSP